MSPTKMNTKEHSKAKGGQSSMFFKVSKNLSPVKTRPSRPSGAKFDQLKLKLQNEEIGSSKFHSLQPESDDNPPGAAEHTFASPQSALPQSSRSTPPIDAVSKEEEVKVATPVKQGKYKVTKKQSSSAKKQVSPAKKPAIDLTEYSSKEIEFAEMLASHANRKRIKLEDLDMAKSFFVPKK